ncbi:VOC family protein [Kribbella ginsengisoli]|uniref:VOC family protein n=1 Tax=Kribbella ginsengisoli TaxID=363865 RepID=A0ABP6W208_9ACTN
MSTFLIDVPKEQAAEASTFWAAALNATPESEPGEPQYTDLKGALPGFVLAVQAVDDEPRYHLDIETDDVAAEVARLAGLGAVEVASWQGCHTMRVPGGQLLCVIPMHSAPEEFAERATTWS